METFFTKNVSNSVNFYQIAHGMPKHWAIRVKFVGSKKA